MLEWAILIVGFLTCVFAGGTLLFQILDRRPKISVEQDTALLCLSATAEDLWFYITNPSNKPVRIENVWIRYKGKSLEELPGGNPVTFINMDVQQGPSVPCWLNPTESIQFSADLSHVAEDLRSAGQRGSGKVYLSVVDGLGNERKQEIVIPISEPASSGGYQEQAEGPESVSEEPKGTAPRSITSSPSESTQRPWWRKVFGG